jgi:ABC-type proline/glycine betaine transport system substrate-binding protein
MADTDQIPMMAAIDNRNEPLAEVTKAWVDANQSKWQPWVDAALKGN